MKQLKKAGKRSLPAARLGGVALALLFGLGAGCAEADQTFQMGTDSSLSLGFGVRTSYTNLQYGAPNGSSASNNFNVDDFRLYVSGQMNKVIGGTFNTERDSSGNIVMMDGITRFEFTPDFNVWAGRLLPPSDRSNLDGPFYLNVWSYPLVSMYPSVAIGRDNGAVIWGKPMGGKVVYSVGAFGGHNDGAGDSDNSGDLLYAGRLVINFLDPEPAPAYYNASTYYGSKDILSLGMVWQYQQNGVGNSPSTAGDYSSGNLDLLFEKKLAGSDVLTIEGAYYHYGLGAVDCGSGEPGSQPCAYTSSGNSDFGGLVDGHAYLATLEYMFGEKFGPDGFRGQWQPFVRYQELDRSLSGTTDKQTDVGVNYVINGFNAKLSAVYSKLEDSRMIAPLNNVNQFIVGFQYQY